MKQPNRHWWKRGQWSFEIEYNLGEDASFYQAQIRLNAIDGDHGIQLALCIRKLFDIWFTFDHPSLKRWLPTKRTKSYSDSRKEEYWDMPIEKHIGLKWHSNTFWWSLWETSMEWSSSQPWWWGGAFHPDDFLLGRSKHTKENEAPVNAILSMPEGDYQVTGSSYTSVWKRSRWPRSKRVKRFDISYEPPLPVPGKGENYWDIDDDAVFSAVISAETLENALKKQRNSILRDRERYSGKGWVPGTGWSVANEANDGA